MKPTFPRLFSNILKINGIVKLLWLSIKHLIFNALEQDDATCSWERSLGEIITQKVAQNEYLLILHKGINLNCNKNTFIEGNI